MLSKARFCCCRSASCAVALVASTLIAQRSLYDHVERVATALEQDGLAGGRQAVSQIVGRDPDALDEAGVARAAIESLAENFSDGVVAPVFWLAVGGLAGGAAYKAINTADSMIGHRTPRHERLRLGRRTSSTISSTCRRRGLSALLIVAGRGAHHRCVRQRMRGARCGATPASTARRTPAGRRRRWPARSGFRSPARVSMAASWSTMRRWATAAARRTAQDIRAALALYRRADAILIALVAALALAVIALG